LASLNEHAAVLSLGNKAPSNLSHDSFDRPITINAGEPFTVDGKSRVGVDDA
jgi:hypothetical protein